MTEPYFIFKGISSKDMGILVNEPPPPVKPPRDINKIVIPGRDGFLTEDAGTYRETIKSCECTLIDYTKVDQICAWLDGSGEVIFSNQPDHKYQASIINEIPFERILYQYYKFVIVFDCQPFRYAIDDAQHVTKPLQNTTQYNEIDNRITRAYRSLNPLQLLNPTTDSNPYFDANKWVELDYGTIDIDTKTICADASFIWDGNIMISRSEDQNGRYETVTIYEPYTLIDLDLELDYALDNAGTMQSKPIITVYGTGTITLTVNGDTITLNSVDGYVTIDSYLEDAYKETEPKNNYMIGEFPRLKPGSNQISWTGSVAKLEIKCNSAWL